ncbi:MAG TPA: hypothetical protein VFY13_04180, partial [Luteolibacter sp.]|nr:hypothetical protein [Luteolibacter sp.]
SIARFNQQLQQIEGTSAKIKLCSDALSDPQRKNTFEKIAAMDQLADLLGADAFELLLPYLNHDYWRLREHSLNTAAKLIRSGGAKQLAALYQPKDRANEAVGILAAFARSGDATGSKLATSALAEESPELRRQAAITLASIDKDKAISPIIGQLGKASHPLERDGCEIALNQLAASSSAKVRDAVIAALGGLKAENLASAWYVLACIGDDPSLDVLVKAGSTKSKTEFSALAAALSYSPSRRADKILLNFASVDKDSAALVGPHAVRRMVLGPKGFGDLTDEQRMEFAEPMIKLVMDPELVKFLGQVHHARALRALVYCLRNGVTSAAETIVVNAENTKTFPTEDAKVAADALRDVIEYIEVTQLRGGAEGKDFRYYPQWKLLQARAGKVLLKVHKPESKPIAPLQGLDLE